MVFSSITFLFVFLPLVILAYFICPKKARNLVLLIASLLFYTWAEPFFVFLLIFLILTDYFAGRLIQRYRKQKAALNTVFVVAIVLNICALILFKYQVFPSGIQDTVNNNAFVSLMIPLGISIYVFQGMSYVIDLYWNKIKLQRNLLDFSMYVSFFPQMVCGPIVRYSDIKNEISHRQESYNKISKGYGMFIRGLAKKLLLADNMLLIWNSIKVQPHDTLSAVTAWIGILAFAFAIYFYFSGYTDMARGLAKIFGFEFPLNFNYPYLSKSVVEFWRRWNISLTVWFKTYLFTPIGKNNNSFFLSLFKLVGIWLVMGIWYGGQFNFFLWGLYFGVIIIVEKLFLSSLLVHLPKFIQQLYTFLLVLFGWVIFEMDTLSQMASYFNAMFAGNSGAIMDSTALYYLRGFFLLFVICIIACRNIGHNLALKYEHSKPRISLWVRVIAETVLTIVCFISVIGSQLPDQSFFFRF